MGKGHQANQQQTGQQQGNKFSHDKVAPLFLGVLFFCGRTLMKVS
jgi:hypothetical protein